MQVLDSIYDFSPYPFERLNELIKDIKPRKEIINISIGEPQFSTPQFIQDELKNNSFMLKKYPPSLGIDGLRIAQMDFVRRRFGIDLHSVEIIPTLGSREVLFNFPIFLLGEKTNSTMAFPNPFYKIYEASAIASKSNIIHMNLDSNNDFTPSLSEEDLQKVDLVILNSPNNPTGNALSLNELCRWVDLALKHDFVIINDECYSDIYELSPPPSILQASIRVKNYAFKNVIAINSISKRSSAPGLRSGYIAGDRSILKKYAIYRTYIGCASPLPLQMASIAAWNNDYYSDFFRKIYASNLKLAREILNVDVKPYTFYVWLKVEDDIKFTTRLYAGEGILVLPGRFLGNGEGYVRIALVFNETKTKEILLRLKNWI